MSIYDIYTEIHEAYSDLSAVLQEKEMAGYDTSKNQEKEKEILGNLASKIEKYLVNK